MVADKRACTVFRYRGLTPIAIFVRWPFRCANPTLIVYIMRAPRRSQSDGYRSGAMNSLFQWHRPLADGLFELPRRTADATTAKLNVFS
jgi:hypothetical protein